MSKIKSLDDLRKMKEKLQASVHLRENGERCDQLVQIRVAMATCGIAAGGKEVLNCLVDQLDRRNIEAVVTQTGCMGYCYAEPTIEVTLPGSDPVVFGEVDTEKAAEIVDRYVVKGELLPGIIPVNYEVVDND
ncbi:NADP oxidoreductase [Desulfoluna limicola]|uniref:NADP oxidoreductase n=1 Tax=Desulfoluna limicola TaxID=2810562 RepID=A0ABM7PIP9_9BACT|nr:(2Fe-2S) ferredoxin domain-containing protein [Desulfoluna limicola]BCS97034.1 NADP oxidoreductase [Desulfoluna limicola]